MSICQLGMHNNVQGPRNATVCKQTYDASCTCLRINFLARSWCVSAAAALDSIFETSRHVMDMASHGSPALDTQMSLAPAVEDSMQSVGMHSLSSEGMASMPMWFQASTKTYLWFKEWNVDDQAK